MFAIFSGHRIKQHLQNMHISLNGADFCWCFTFLRICSHHWRFGGFILFAAATLDSEVVMKFISLKYITKYSNIRVFEQPCAIRTKAICGIGMPLTSRKTYQRRMDQVKAYLSRKAAYLPPYRLV